MTIRVRGGTVTWIGIATMTRLALIAVMASSAVSTIALVADAVAAGSSLESGYRTLFTQLEKTDFVTEGARAPKSVLYVFFDANCLYCRLTWKALRPYEDAGLQVRWVPVAYQQPSSVGRAAAIMQAADRSAALRVNATGYDTVRFDGGIRPLDKVPEALVAQLEANTQLMRKFGAPGTPALVWKDHDGRVQFKAGVPRQSELPRMTRLRAEPNNDPELASFR